jgi:WD40 repeat protein/serine/threonine protein kinase
LVATLGVKGGVSVREREIFLAAAEIDEPNERLHYVQQACSGDDVLRQRIVDLLAIHEQEKQHLSQFDSGSDARNGTPAPEECEGTTLGRYRLLEKIGEGGFALVYMAEQTEPVRRRVALKIIKAGMDTRHVVARFEAERQALALMDHPHIAKIFDAGVTPSGRPYFVMELVAGRPITEFCDAQRLTTNERLQVLLQVCHAVQHAHQKGIIHRDLKPSNILVAIHDDAPVAKVIDFGIAKATEHPLTDKTLFTRFHQFIGTPAYMSPEQTMLGGTDVDTRTDVYSLGAVLYELLVGVAPLEEQLEKAAFDDVSRILRDEQPSLPSARISTLGDRLTTVAENRRAEPQQLRRFVRGDLDWIIMKALEKDRSRRYETVSSLAADVQHFLAREPVSAGPPSTVYRIRKFVTRHRGSVAAAMALSATLIAGTIGSTAGLISAVRAKSVAEQAKRAADEARNQESAARRTALDEIERKRQLLYVADTSNAKHAWDAGNVDYAVTLLKRHVPKPGEDDLRTFAWYHLWDQCHQYEANLVHDAPLHTLVYSPDGQVLACAGEGGRVMFWRADTREPLFTLSVEMETVMSVRFSPDGNTLAVGGGTGHQPWKSPGSVELWDWKRRTRLRTVQPGISMVCCVAFDSDGDRLASSSYSGAIQIWDLSDAGEDKPTLTIQQPERLTFSIQFSSNGEMLAAGSWSPGAHAVRFWDSRTGEESQTVEVNGDVRGLAYSPDGKHLAAGTMNANGSLKLIDVDSGDVRTLPAEDCIVETLAFSSDSAKLFAGNWKGSIHVFDLPSGELAAILKGHSSVVTAISLSPDGKTLASCGHDRTTKLWNIANSVPPESITIGHEWDAPWMKYSHDSKLLATSSFPGGPGKAEGSVRLWDVASGRLLETCREGPGVARCIAISPANDRLAWVDSVRGANSGRTSTVVVRELTTGRQQSLGTLEAQPLHLNFSSDGRLLSVIDYRQTTSDTHEHALSTTTWSLETGQRISREELGTVELTSEGTRSTPGFPRFRHAHWGEEFYTRLSADGRLFARGHGSSVRLWDLATGKLRVLQGHSEFAFYVTFCSTGERLASCSQDRSICLWNTNTGELVQTLVGRTWPITLAFSPDGTTLATGDLDGKVTLWDLRTFTEIVALDADVDIVNGLSFSPDGQSLACGTLGGKICIWRAPRP